MLAKLARGSSFNDIELPDMTELPKLHRAAYSKDVERVGEILSKRRVDMDKRDSRGRTAFHYGCLAGSTEVIELLHSHCPDLHLRKDSQGRCPAYLAIKHGHLDCIKLLFVYGENFDEKDDSGICPLHFSITEHQTEIAKFLIKNGNADLNAKDPHLLTALHHACANGLLSTAKLLVESGVKINAKDCYGRTPLMLAAADGSEECVKMLIENGANPEISDRRGLTAKAWALKKDHHRLLTLLDGTSNQSTSGCKMDSEDSGEKAALKQMSNTPESTKGQCDHDASPRSCEDEGEASSSSFSENDGFVQAVTSSPSETLFLLETSSAEMKNNVNVQKTNTDYHELTNKPDKDATDNSKKSNRSHVRFAENPEVVQYGISSDNQSSTETMLTTSEQNSTQEAAMSVSENTVQPKIWDNNVLSETQEQINQEEVANVNISSDTVNEGRRMSNVIYSKESFENDLVNFSKECSASDVPEITMTVYDDTDEEEFPNRHSAKPVMDYSSSASEEFALSVEQPACRPSREFIATKFDDQGLIDSSIVPVDATGTKSCIAESSSETEFLIRSNINLSKPSKTSSNEIDIEKMSPANFGGCSSTKIISLKEKNEELVKELFHSIQDFCVTERRAEGLEDKLNRLACNLKIEKARAEHEHLVANDLERNVSALKQLQSQLQEDLERAREHSRCKDYENNILKMKLESIISYIKERRTQDIVCTSGDNIDDELFKVVESSENVLQEIKADGESGFSLEKDLLKDKLLLISEKTELRRKARELQCSNEYFEKKVIKLNSECVKKAKENRILQEKLEELKAEFHCEKHSRLSDIEKSSFVKTNFDGIEIGTCNPVLSKTEDAEGPSHPGVNVGSQKSFEDKPVCCQFEKMDRALGEGSCCLQFDNAPTEIPKDNHNKKRKIAEELKLRFVDKSEELKKELIQARTDLQLEKEKVRRLSLHDELKDRFVISLESLQNELSLLKRKKEASLTCAKTKGDFDKLIQEEKTKFDSKLMEQNKTINLLRECVSETRQNQSKYMQLYADAKLKADRYDELVGSNLQLEEALNEAYKRIDELEHIDDKYTKNEHHQLDIEGNAAYPTVYFVRNGTDEVEKLEKLVKCEQLIGKRLQNLRESGSSLGAVDSGCEDSPAKYLIFNENQTEQIAEQLANLQGGNGNFAGVRMVEASHSQGQLLLELENAKAKIKNLLCTTSDVNEQKQYMVEKIEHLKKENTKLAETIREAAGRAGSDKAATARNNSEVSNESTELARELWKTRQSLEDSEKENLKLKEEIKALEGKFVKIKEKAEKFAQNDDTMISMEDILEENASLMETNEEIVERYNELLKKLNGSPDENASNYKTDEDNQTTSYEGSGIAGQGSDRYKEKNTKLVGFSDGLLHGEIVNSAFEQNRRNTLISSDIKLSDLVRAMNSDTSGDDTDDDIDDREIIEHVRRASIRYYEGGCKEDGSLLEEVDKLTHANNSLKDKVAFLEGWTDNLNEELLRLQTDLEAVENDKKAINEKLQRQISKCNALESDIDNLQKEDAVFIDNNKEGSASLSSIQFKDGPIVNNDNTLVGESEREELLELKEKYASMQAHAEEWNNELSEKIHRLQSYLQNAYDENNELKLENDKLKDFMEDCRKLQSKCDELENKSSYLVAELQACQGEICMLRSAEAKSNMKVKEYETLKLNLQNEVDDLNDRIKALMKDLEDMRIEDEILFEVKQSYEQAVKQIGELREALQGSEKSNIEVEELRNEVIKHVGVNEENIKLNACIASLKQETDDLQGKTKELIFDNNRIQAQLEMLSAENSISNEKVSLLEEELGRKQVENAQLENTVNLLEKESKELVEKLQEKLILQDSREKYIKELEKDVATTKEEIERISEIDDEKIELEIKLTGLQKKIATIEDMVEKYEDKVKDPTEKKLEQCLHGAKMQRMELENLRKDNENLKKENIQLDKDKRHLLDKIKIADRIETERRQYVFEMEKGHEIVYNELEELRNINKQEQILGNESEKNEKRRLGLIEALIVERLSEQQESSRMCIEDAVNASDTAEMSFLGNIEDTGNQYVEKVVTALFDECEKLSVKVESMEKRIIELHDLRVKFDSLSKENIQLKKNENKWNMREKQFSDMQKKFDHVSMEYESKQSELNMLKKSKKVFEKGKEKNDLDQNHMKLLQDENSSLKDENERLEANVEILGKEKQDLLRIREQYDELRAENLTMKQNENKRHLKEQQLSNLQKKLDQISKEYESKKSEVDILKETEKELVKEKEKSNSLHNRMTHLQDENSSLKDENERLEANVEILGKEKQDLLRIREQYDELRAENLTMKQNENKRHLKEQQLSDLQKKLDQISKEYESKKSEVDVLKETEKELVKEKEKSNSLHNRMTHLQDENSSLKDENERLEATVEVLGKEKQDLLRIREQYDELRAENLTMKQNENKRHLKEQQLSDLQKKLDQISKEYESKKSEVDVLKETEKELVKEKEKSNSLHNRMTHLQDENSSLKDENERLEANVEILGKEKQDLLRIREQYDELRAENLTMKQNENKRHLKEKQLSDLQKKLDQISKEYESKKSEVDVLKETEKELVKEKEKSNSLHNRMTHLQDENSSLKDENERLEANVEILGKEKQDLLRIREQYDELRAENLTMKQNENKRHLKEQQLSDLQKKLDQISKEYESKKSKVDVLKETEKELVKEKEKSNSLHNRMTHLQDENSSLKDENERLESNVEILRKEKQDLFRIREQYDELRAENLTMKQNENKRHLKEQQLSDLQKKLDQISKEYALKETEVNERREASKYLEMEQMRNEKLQIDIKALHQQITVLKDENEILSLNSFELRENLERNSYSLKSFTQKCAILESEIMELREKANWVDILKEENKELVYQIEFTGEELRSCRNAAIQNNEEISHLNAKLYDLTKKEEFEQTKKVRESGILESICVLIGDKLDENKELFSDELDLGRWLVSNEGQHDDGNDNDVIRNRYVRKTIKLLFSEVKQLAAKAALMEKGVESLNELREKFDSVHKESIKMKQNENKHRLTERELLNKQQELALISENSEQILRKNHLLTKEISSLTASNECLKKENQTMSKDALELKQKLSSTHDAFKKEKEQTRLMDLEAKLLRQEMNALKEEKRELLNQSNVLKKELDEWKCYIKQNDIFQAEQEKKNQQLNELLKGKESQLVEITNAINLKVMELEQLGAEKHDLSLALDKERKSVELACKANDELKTENESLKSKVECYEATSAEIEELRNFLKSATENLEQFESEKEKLRDELTDAKKQTASYQDLCANLKADMDREKGLIESLVKEKDILDSNCCNLVKDNKALSHKLKTYLCEKSQLEDERSALQKELDLVRSELDRKESQEDELQLLKSELLMIRGKAKEIWNKLIEMKAAAEHYSAENTKINSCLNEAREKMRFIQEENAVLTQEAIKLTTEKDALESFKFESFEMQKRLVIKTEELDIMQKKYDELSRSLTALKKEMEELNHMENIRDLENQLLEAEDSNVCIANEKTAIEDQLKKVLKENVLLKDDIRINDNNRNEDLRVIGDLRKELMDVKEKLVMLEENNDQIQAVSSERDEAGRRCMETERQTFEIDLQEQLKCITTLEESIEEQNRVICEKEQKLQDLVFQVNSLTEEKNELLQQSSLSNVSSQRYEMKLHDKENAKHNLEKKVENLLETVRDLKSENEKMNQLYSHCLGNNEKLTHQLRSLECKLSASQEQHDHLWEKYRETRKELKERELEQARNNALQIESGKKTAAEPEMSLEESIHGSKELQRNMARRFLTSIARAQYCDVKPILKPKEKFFQE